MRELLDSVAAPLLNLAYEAPHGFPHQKGVMNVMVKLDEDYGILKPEDGKPEDVSTISDRWRVAMKHCVDLKKATGRHTRKRSQMSCHILPLSRFLVWRLRLATHFED